SADRTTSTDRSGTVTQCTTYLCDPKNGLCGSTCTLVTDCASSFTCDSTSKCVPAIAPNDSASGSGCGVANDGRRPHGSALATCSLLAFAALFLRRRHFVSTVSRRPRS
ncbi:MAG: hypothetical protein ACHREM_28330, partial [Polyangiales bacterium]